MLKRIWLLLIIPFVFMVSAAMAAESYPGFASSDVNMRTGPGPKYPVIRAIPKGAVVNILYCNFNGTWCDLTYNGQPGWVYSRYLRYGVEGQYLGQSITYVAPLIGLPFFDYDEYPIYPGPAGPREEPAIPLEPGQPAEAPQIPLTPSQPASEVPEVPLTPAQPTAPPVEPAIPLEPAAPISPPVVPETPLSPAK